MSRETRITELTNPVNVPKDRRIPAGWRGLVFCLNRVLVFTEGACLLGPCGRIFNMLSWLPPASGWHSWLADGTKKEGELWKLVELINGKDYGMFSSTVHLSSLTRFR